MLALGTTSEVPLAKALDELDFFPSFCAPLPIFAFRFFAGFATVGGCATASQDAVRKTNCRSYLRSSNVNCARSAVTPRASPRSTVLDRCSDDAFFASRSPGVQRNRVPVTTSMDESQPELVVPTRASNEGMFS